jgi:3-oxoadipate enol-lactonase
MFAETTDGVNIHYAINGRGPARAALIHSLALDHTFWTPVAERLAEDAEVLVLDCRGHGASDKPPGPYSAALFADDLAAVMTAAGWDQAVVAGCSLGGCVALAFAVRHAERCAGLGLFDTTAWYGADAPEVWAQRGRKVLAEGMQSLTAIQLTRWFSDAFRAEHPDVAARCGDIFERNDPRAFADSCHLLGALDLRSSLASIAVPTHILIGQDDDATPLPMSEDLKAGIAGARLDVIPGRHLTPLESPGPVAETLRALVRSV